MRTAFRRRLTYANVMATLAFFLALGGGAYAAATVGSSQIKKNAVLSRHIKNGQVKGSDLAANSVGSGKVIDGSVGNSDLGSNSVGAGNVINGSLQASDFAPAALGARAWALGGQDSCENNNTLCPLSSSKGVSSIRHISGGTYCVAVRGIQASSPGNVALVGAADVVDSDVHVNWHQHNARTCIPSDFEIVTSVQGTIAVRNATGNGTQKVSLPGQPEPATQFVIVIP